MAVRALLKMIDEPLPLIVDMYDKILVPSLTEDSEEDYNMMIEALSYAYFKTNTEDKCPFMDWKDVKNRLLFTIGYVEIFEEYPVCAVWIAYEALNMLLSVYPDFYAPELHVFNWKGHSFWIKGQKDHVVFMIPEEL